MKKKEELSLGGSVVVTIIFAVLACYPITVMLVL